MMTRPEDHVISRNHGKFCLRSSERDFPVAFLHAAVALNIDPYATASTHFGPSCEGVLTQQQTGYALICSAAKCRNKGINLSSRCNAGPYENRLLGTGEPTG